MKIRKYEKIYVKEGDIDSVIQLLQQIKEENGNIEVAVKKDVPMGFDILITVEIIKDKENEDIYVVLG